MTQVVVALCLFFATYDAAQIQKRYNDVPSALSSNGQFTVFIDLLTKSGLLALVNNSPRFTLFAPTDAAFARIPADTLAAIKNDPARLADVIGSHVVLESSSLVDSTKQDLILKTYNKHSIRINDYYMMHTVTANGVNVTIRNIPVGHGFVNGIDGVIVAPSATTAQIIFSRADLSIISSLIVNGSLVNFLTADPDITSFLPNNDAFRGVSPNFLAYLQSHPEDFNETVQYHFVKSATLFSIGLLPSRTYSSANGYSDRLMVLEDDAGAVTINSAKIVQKDIIAKDGVIHIINKVLIPPSVLIHIADRGIVVG
ncbi:unnamed protein product [Lymnaea stagnalis]|uniref:FAS1 domain-containing protein n=1 Tax=Lymnaea stagnalis TaxID=6523 RepID=A0AAV2GYT5_LYMST